MFSTQSSMHLSLGLTQASAQVGQLSQLSATQLFMASASSEAGDSGVIDGKKAVSGRGLQRKVVYSFEVDKTMARLLTAQRSQSALSTEDSSIAAKHLRIYRTPAYSSVATSYSTL